MKDTKICSGCGLAKPLSAFLQLGGPHGVFYGQLCSTCRKTAMEKEKSHKEPEESTRSNSGLKLDPKVVADRGSKQAEELKEEKYEELLENEKRELKQSHQSAKQTEEKKQRDKKTLSQSSFLDPVNRAKELSTREVEKLEKEKKIDTTAPVYTYVPGQLKFGVEFRGYAQRMLPKSSGLAKLASNMFGKSNVTENVKAAEKNQNASEKTAREVAERWPSTPGKKR